MSKQICAIRNMIYPVPIVVSYENFLKGEKI